MCLFSVNICLSQVQLLHVRLKKGAETVGQGALFLDVVFTHYTESYCCFCEPLLT